jgi:hypothetical protein
MAASIARKVATVLVAFAVVGSMGVGPALADDDGEIDVSGDGVSVGGDDGTTVSAGDDGSTNGSSTVSVEADSDGADSDVSVSGGDGSGTDGSVDCDVSTETQDPTDACESSATGGDGDSGGDSIEVPETGDAPEAPDTGDTPEAPDTGEDQVPDIEIPEDDAPEAPGGSGGVDIGSREVSTPDEPVEAPDLPISYQDDVPFEAFPPFCEEYVSGDDVPQPVDPTDPVSDTPVNKSQLPKEAQEPPSTPVGNPIGLVSAPINQCTVFNPYSPQVNPTDPPDDPSATAEANQGEAGADGGQWIGTGSATTGEGGPGGDALTAAWADQEQSGVVFDINANDGSSPFGASGDVRSPNQPNRTTGTFGAVVFGKTAGASLNCDGSQCKPKASGVPSGNAAPAIPAGGGSGGSSIPCDPPVSAEDVAGQVPVDPTNPPGPDQIGGQRVPPQTPVGNPVGLVSAPISYCAVFNPNDPPVNASNPPQNPDASPETYEQSAGQDGVTYFGGSEAQTGEGDGTQQADTLYRFDGSQDRARGILIIEGDDGSKPYYSETRTDYQPGTTKGDAFTTFEVFGKSAGASLNCDGSKCKPKASGVPSGNAVPAIPTGGSDDGGQPEPDPSADTGQPELADVGQDGAVIVDDRGASLGDGLPGGDSETVIIGNQEDGRVEQQGDADTGQGNGANSDVEYERGAYPGDDDGKAAVKADNGAGVVVKSECQDYDCDTSGTGLYAPSGGLPVSPPGGAPSPGSLTQTLMGML